MLSHELARILLESPNLPVSTHAMGNTYSSKAHARSHGELHIGILNHYAGDHLIIGDMDWNGFIGGNQSIQEMIHPPQQFDPSLKAPPAS